MFYESFVAKTKSIFQKNKIKARIFKKRVGWNRMHCCHVKEFFAFWLCERIKLVSTQPHHNLSSQSITKWRWEAEDKVFT